MARAGAIAAAGVISLALGGGALGQVDPFGALHQGAGPSGPGARGSAGLGAGPASAPARMGAQGLSNIVGASYSAAEMKGPTMSLAQLAFLPKTLPPLDVPVKAFKPDYLGKRPRVAIPQYAIAFVTGYQSAATAAGRGSDITPRSSKVTTTLIGVPDALKQQLVDEAYADLLARLQAAGIEVVPVAQTQAAPHLQSLQRPQTPSGHDVARMWTVWGAGQAPLVRGYAADEGLATAGASIAMGHVSQELAAVVLLPSLSIDYLNIANSGRSLYGGSASVEAELKFHLGPSFINFIWGNDRGGAMPGVLTTPGKGSPELFGILYKLEDRSDSVALHNAFAEAGFGSIYRQSLVYGVEVVPERYAALTRAAFQGANQALVDQILRARTPSKT